jgi:serine/threonine-protein kinase
MQVLQPHERHFGGYEIVREVARGNYAAVYEARHTYVLPERRIALRVLSHKYFASHFMWAAKLNAWLDHPRIPALLDVGETAGRRYWARCFIEGDDLQNGIGGPGRNVEEVLRIIADMASALDCAHERGVVHGYVHPRHILLGTNGPGWLIGIGEYPPPSPELLGNPLHFAPEQFDARTVTPASDIYCLSETCFWLLCGRHPFHGFRTTELLEAKRSGRLARELRVIRPDISPGVEEVLLQAMAPDPGARYATPGEFARALLAAHRGGKEA